MIAYTKTSFAFISFLLVIFCLSCSDDTEKEISQEASERLELMERIMGEYKVEGRYGGETLAPQTIILSEVNDQELEISGTGFPAFKIRNWYKSYNNPNNPEEFTVSAEPVEPNEGIVTISFPEGEIGIAVKIQEGEISKKDLILNGAKK